MQAIYRILTILIIPLFIIFTTVSADAKPSTSYTPETVESKPVVVVEPVEVATLPKKGISIWWYILGAALIAGAAAGSGKKDSSSSSSGGGGGTIPVTW